MDKTSFAANRQTLLMGVAVTGLTLAIAFSIQPLLPLSESGRNVAEEDPLADLEQSVIEEPAAEIASGESDETPPGASEAVVADETPAAISAGVEEPQRFVRRSDRQNEIFAAIEGVETVMPPSYQQRLALLNDEQELSLRSIDREPAALLETKASEPAQIAMVSVEESAEQAPAVVPAVAHSTNAQEFKRVKLVRHNPLRADSGPTEATRGAWLAGTIELD